MDKSMEILDLLCENSRLTEKQMAAITGLVKKKLKTQ